MNLLIFIATRVLTAAECAEESIQGWKSLQPKLELGGGTGQICTPDRSNALAPESRLLATDLCSVSVVAKPAPDPATQLWIGQLASVVLPDVQDELVVPHADSFIHGVINILAREAATYPKYWMNP